VAFATSESPIVVHAVPGRLRWRVPALRDQPALAARFAATAEAHPGVRRVRVNPDCASVVVECDPAAYERLLHDHAADAWMATAAVAPEAAPPAAMADVALASTSPAETTSEPPAPGAPALVLTLAALGFSFVGGGLPRALALMALAHGAAPGLRYAVRRALRERRPRVELLDAAVLLIMLLAGDVRGAALTQLLVFVGEEIRARTARRTRRGTISLDHTLGSAAWLVLGDEQVRVPVERLRRDDVVAVHTREQVPVDGVVESGEARLDQRLLTGEGRSIRKATGDAVLAGSRVLQGDLHVRATATGADTRAGWVVHTLQQAPTHDTRAADYGDRVADRMVLPTLAVAGLAYAATRDASRLAAILIVDWATGIELSAPTSVLTTMARAARDGILIKSGHAVEALAAADAVVFDKTGTLTRGRPEVAEVVSLDPALPPDELLALAASAEQPLRHPIAAAVLRYARARGVAVPERESGEYVPRLGMLATVRQRTVRVGSSRFLTEAGLGVENPTAAQLAEQGYSVVHVGVDQALAGLIAYHDPAREESAGVVAWLLAHGVQEVHLVTGDSLPAAQALAGRLGIANVHAGLLPDDKAALVRALQRRGRAVAMVGEGLDDAPALVQADVSISLAHGVDVAREIADIVLLERDLMGLVRAVEWCRFSRGLIRENFLLVAVPNVITLLLAATGRVSPVIARLLSDGSTLLAAGNSLRPLLGPVPVAWPLTLEA
jgi:Cu2+-exporting ATPase